MREKKREREIVGRRREREIDQSMPPIAYEREKLKRYQRPIIPRATTEGALQIESASASRDRKG